MSWFRNCLLLVPEIFEETTPSYECYLFQSYSSLKWLHRGVHGCMSWAIAVWFLFWFLRFLFINGICSACRQASTFSTILITKLFNIPSLWRRKDILWYILIIMVVYHNIAVCFCRYVDLSWGCGSCSLWDAGFWHVAGYKPVCRRLQRQSNSQSWGGTGDG